LTIEEQFQFVMSHVLKKTATPERI
jgi:hypothetical protein